MINTLALCMFITGIIIIAVFLLAFSRKVEKNKEAELILEAFKTYWKWLPKLKDCDIYKNIHPHLESRDMNELIFNWMLNDDIKPFIGTEPLLRYVRQLKSVIFNEDMKVHKHIYNSKLYDVNAKRLISNLYTYFEARVGIAIENGKDIIPRNATLTEIADKIKFTLISKYALKKATFMINSVTFDYICDRRSVQSALSDWNDRYRIRVKENQKSFIDKHVKPKRDRIWLDAEKIHSLMIKCFIAGDKSDKFKLYLLDSGKEEIVLIMEYLPFMIDSIFINGLKNGNKFLDSLGHSERNKCQILLKQYQMGRELDKELCFNTINELMDGGIYNKAENFYGLRLHFRE